MSTVAGSSSSAEQRRCLPRIPCPVCKIQVIRLTSNKGKVFYKCPNNFQNDKTSCQQYWFEEKYVNYLKDNHPDLLQGFEDELAAVACQSLKENHTDLKRCEPNNICDTNPVELELKMQIMGINLELEKMKADIKELKEVCDKGKGRGYAWGLDVAIALAMYVVLLAAVVWKK